MATVEETRLEQERLGTRPAPAPCSYGLCPLGRDHPAGHGWLDNVAPHQYPIGYQAALDALLESDGPDVALFSLLTEGGDDIATETGDILEIEHA